MKSEWTYRPLGELVSFASGGTPSKKRDDYWGGTIPWISAKTLKTENIDTSDLFITEEGLKAGSKIAPKGSILLLTRGSGLFNGIPIARVEKDVAFNQDIKCLDSYGEVENEFIFYWLLSQKDYLMAKVGVTGIGAGKFDLDFLQKLMIATVYKGNIIKNLIMDCQSYTKYRPNETTGGIFVSWRRKEELPTGA